MKELHVSLHGETHLTEHTRPCEWIWLLRWRQPRLLLSFHPIVLRGGNSIRQLDSCGIGFLDLSQTPRAACNERVSTHRMSEATFIPKFAFSIPCEKLARQLDVPRNRCFPLHVDGTIYVQIRLGLSMLKPLLPVRILFTIIARVIRIRRRQRRCRVRVETRRFVTV